MLAEWIPVRWIAPLTTVLEAYKIMEEDFIGSKQPDRSRSITTSMYGELEQSSSDALRTDGSDKMRVEPLGKTAQIRSRSMTMILPGRMRATVSHIIRYEKWSVDGDILVDLSQEVGYETIIISMAGNGSYEAFEKPADSGPMSSRGRSSRKYPVHAGRRRAHKPSTIRLKK